MKQWPKQLKCFDGVQFFSSNGKFVIGVLDKVKKLVIIFSIVNDF